MREGVLDQVLTVLRHEVPTLTLTLTPTPTLTLTLTVLGNEVPDALAVHEGRLHDLAHSGAHLARSVARLSGQGQGWGQGWGRRVARVRVGASARPQARGMVGSRCR